MLLALWPTNLNAQSNEEQLREDAEELFEAENYEDAFEKYSQLLSLKLENPEYNYRFGACQLFTSHDKEAALQYLRFAINSENPPNLAHFYYGLGLHLNYRFEKAIDQYELYQENAGKKEKEAKLVSHYIEQCKSGIALVSSFTDISVVNRETLPRTEFYRNYDLSDFGGKIIVKPEDFMSEEDQKRDAKFLMYFQQDAEYIYYASYSEKNATGKDLFAIQKLPTGDWSKPTQLSQVINTPYDEDYPFIHPDGNVLYFASKGHNSMGGYDIFKSTRKGDGTWTKPQNMEFAINTPWDDFLFISDKEEKIAWFASNRETSIDEVTVYKIGIDRVPLDLTLIKGTFEAPGSKKAKITVEDVVQKKIIGIFESERQFGDYLIDLRGSGQYKFIVEAEESNAIHTGLVEIPREKGLKQFRQEMNLLVKDGKEQLQIINHFDEPLSGDESLLTAEILRKQANMRVNASEDELIRTTELLDESASETASNAGLSNEDMIAAATEQIDQMNADADQLDAKANTLAAKAAEKQTSDDPAALAEAAIASELALEFKEEAERRKSAASKMEQKLSEANAAVENEDAFKASINQISATSANFKSLGQFEEKLSKEMEQRKVPSIALYEAKAEELEELKDDLVAIDEEITYYQSEIETTKDEAVKEELNLQVSDAKAAIPEKQAAIERAEKELVALEQQKQSAIAYGEISQSLIIVTANEDAPAVTDQEITAIQSSISEQVNADAALVAFIEPDMAKEATEAALLASRTARDPANNDSNEGIENDESTNAESANEESATEDVGVSDTESAEEFESDAPSETQSTDNGELATNDSDAPAEQNDNDEGEGNDALNEEIRIITATESTPEIIPGDYGSVLQSQINEAANAEDPMIAESRKAELYDQWAENIEFRIDSLEDRLNVVSSTEDKLEIANDIQSLEAAKQEKEDLAMESYTRIAALSDEQANAAAAADLNLSDPVSDEAETTAATEDDPEVSTPAEDQAVTSTPRDAADEQGTTPSTQAAAETQPSRSGVGVSLPPADSVPPAVAGINATYVQRIDSINNLTDKGEKLSTKAQAYKAWASELQEELTLLGQQIVAAPTSQDRRRIEEQAAAVSQLRRDVQSKSSEFAQQSLAEQEKEQYAAEQAQLQNQLLEYIESYNSEAFVSLDEQLNQIENPTERKAQAEVLNQNWMMAIQNEQFKLERRLANTTDPNQQADIREQLIDLSAEKLYVEATLDSLQSPEVAGPKAPKAVVIQGSERYEGYRPVRSEKPQEYDNRTQSTYAELDQARQEVKEAEATLASTKKKKEIPAAELAVERKQHALEVIELETAFYEQAETKLNGVEPLLLQMNPGDPTPAEKQMQEAEVINMEAERLVAAAANLREEANNTKKKKLKSQAEAAAREAEHVAFLKQREAQLATILAGEMAQIENRAIEENFIIPAGEEVALPIVNRKLNPTEQADVASTPEFQAYNAKKRRADSLRQMAMNLEAVEQQLQDRAQASMLSSENLDPSLPAKERLKQVNEAFVIYEKADSVSQEIARLNRQAALIENDANQALLLNPEEVYNSVIAYYNSDSTGTAGPSDAEVAELISAIETGGPIDTTTTSITEVATPATEDADGTNEAALPSDTDESAATPDLTERATDTPEIDAPAEEGAITSDEAPQNEAPEEASDADPFALTPPEEDNQLMDVPNDVLTNTIFEAVPNATTSVYNDANPIPIDPPLPSGILFKVQIGAFRNAISQDAFKGIKPIVGESAGNGLTRYTAGAFKDFASADFAKDEVREIGYPDAFVVAYRNGARISVAEARRLVDAGEAIADNTNETNSGEVNTTNTGAAQVETPNRPGDNTEAATPIADFTPELVEQGPLVIRDVANQSGTYLTVQVGVYSNPVSSADIYNITPLNQENLPNGTYRYSTGIYEDELTATRARDEIRKLGIVDAFVTAYRGGTRITVEEARGTLANVPTPTTTPPAEDTVVATAAPEEVTNESADSASGYRIALGTYQGKVPVEQAAIMLSLPTGAIERVNNADGSITYFYGEFDSQEEAQSTLEELRTQGMSEAKITQ